MSSDDSTTPRRSRRPASPRLPGASPRPQMALASTLWAAMDGIASIRLSGAVFLVLSPDDAADLLNAVAVVVNDPTADERYGAPATVHLTGLLEALADALAGTRVRRKVRKVHPEG